MTERIATDRQLLRYELLLARCWADQLLRLNELSVETHGLVVQRIDTLLRIERTDWRACLAEIGENAGDDVHTLVREHFRGGAMEAFYGLYFYARSRNDSSPTLTRLWIADLRRGCVRTLIDLVERLLKKAEETRGVPFIGFTHQRPNDVTVAGQYFLAHASRLTRCIERIQSTCAELSECPMGVGAMTGAVEPIDREAIARALGFDRPDASGVHGVSDRSFVSDFLYCLSESSAALSTFAHDLLLWSQPPVPIVVLGAAVGTSSVTDARKQNPTTLTDVRRNHSLILGRLHSAALATHNLCSGYSSDLSCDKDLVADSFELFCDSMAKIGSALDGLTIDTHGVRALVEAALAERLALDVARNAGGEHDALSRRIQSKRNYGGDADGAFSRALASARSRIDTLRAPACSS